MDKAFITYLGHKIWHRLYCCSMERMNYRAKLNSWKMVSELLWQFRVEMAVLWNDMENNIEGIHWRELVNGQRVVLKGYENTEFLTPTTGIENRDMAEITNAREGDSLVEEMYFMVEHLNGTAWEEPRWWSCEGREKCIFRTEDEEMG